MQTLIQTWQVFLITFQSNDLVVYIMMFIPFVLILELPLYLICWFGISRHVIENTFEAPVVPPHFPCVTCTITCYSEGKAVQNTVISLLEQIYPGHIEIIAMVDGVKQNKATYDALKALNPLLSSYPNRSLIIIPKFQRGGRVSSMNAGLNRASGEIICALDGDTSFDNQMVYRAALQFNDPNIVSITGPMRVRNANKTLVTRLQNLEYMITMQVGKFGLAKLNVVNNVPGAFGIFRKQFLQQIGGWNTGTAEDLDLTLRIKQYQRRHPELRIDFEPGAVSHTDVPESFSEFLKQRLRWDGDLWYIYAHKHNKGFNPSLLGWPNFIFLLWYGILFQIVMPFVIVIYMILMLMISPLTFFLSSMLIIYLFYSGLTLIQFILFLIFVSDRRLEDLSAIATLPLFPLFQFVVRVWSAIALLNQFFNKGHLDSAMAPLWVLIKGKE